MNRRNFFGLAPVGILAMTALATGKEEKTTEVKKASHLILTGPNGELYHPLVVEKNDVQYTSVEPPKLIGPQSVNLGTFA
jgi:hypothetical protein